MHARTELESNWPDLGFSFSPTRAFPPPSPSTPAFPAPLCLNVQSHVPSALISHTPVSSTARSPPGTDASGWLVCLAAGRSPAATSTWPEFSPVDGYNSSKVAAQTIVCTAARLCQVKGERARQRRNTEGSFLLFSAQIMRRII